MPQKIIAIALERLPWKIGFYETMRLYSHEFSGEKFQGFNVIFQWQCGKLQLHFWPAQKRLYGFGASGSKIALPKAAR